MRSGKCLKFGSSEIGKGTQISGGKMLPLDKLDMSFGSAVIY